MLTLLLSVVLTVSVKATDPTIIYSRLTARGKATDNKSVSSFNRFLCRIDTKCFVVKLGGHPFLQMCLNDITMFWMFLIQAS